MNTDQLLIIPRGSEKIGWKGWPLYSSFYAEGKPHVGFWENGYKKFLNVYYATKAKDMSKLKDFVTNDMTLVFFGINLKMEEKLIMQDITTRM